MSQNLIQTFYDQMTPYYHLVYQDWAASLERQAIQLDKLIQENWGGTDQSILDVACGIGTQALGLAQHAYQVTASDLSALEVERAKTEAKKRGLDIAFSVADMRQAYEHHQSQFDVLIACDNAVPHLLSDKDILQAFSQFYQCLRPGGGLIISVRDYDKEQKTSQIKAEGLHLIDGVRHIMFQVWEFEGDIYELSMYLVKDDGQTSCQTQVMRAHYYAIGTKRLISLLQEAGFTKVKRLDDVYFQPVILATRPTAD